MGLAGCSSSGTRSTPTPSPQPLASRQLAENTLRLREYWRISSIRLPNSPYDSPVLLATSGRVVCVSYESKSFSYVTRLRMYDAASGKLVWEVQLRQGGIFLAIDNERIYVLAHFDIQAYSLNDSQLLWKAQEMPGHAVYFLHSDGEKLYVRDLTNWKVYYLDARTGEQLGSDSLLTGSKFALLAQLPQFDLHTSSRALQAVDKATQQVLWTTDIDKLEPVMRLPVLVDNILLVGIREQVLAIDAQTGQVKWRNKDTPFASNFVVMNGYLYALDEKARLLQLDVKTGQEKGRIQFTPARTSVSDKRYWIAADGQMLFVSFEDSQELIALGP
jgi:outer membrane protein assembly factor BamB